MHHVWLWFHEHGKSVGELVAIGLVLNLPFGYLRAGARKLSVPWFLYLHIPIPFLFIFRHLLGLSMWAIPFSLCAAVIGQICGGNLRVVRRLNGAEV